MSKKNRSKRTGNISPTKLRDMNSEIEKGTTLKDLISSGVLSQLKAQANAMELAEQQKKEEERRKREEARREEQKRLEKDFEYLLNISNLDWKKFK